MNNRRNFLRAASGAVGGFFFATAAEAGAKTTAAKTPPRTILNGSVAPSRRTGVVGDFYIDTRTHSIYGPKRLTGWGHPTSLIGPAGSAGSAGPAGSNGSNAPGGTVSVDSPGVGDYPQWDGSAWVPGNPGANSDGLVGATLADLTVVQSANTTYSQNSGVLIVNACRVNAAATKIAFEVDSPGSGFVPGQNAIGIYGTDGSLVMSTGDLSTTWSSGPQYNIIVVDLPQALQPGLYHVGVLMNYSGTPPFLTGWYCPMITEIGTRFSAVPRVCYGSGTYTALPARVHWTSDGFTANPWNFVTFIGFLP